MSRRAVAEIFRRLFPAASREISKIMNPRVQGMAPTPDLAERNVTGDRPAVLDGPGGTTHSILFPTRQTNDRGLRFGASCGVPVPRIDEVDRFHREFLTKRNIPVTDPPKEYPQYWPGYYAVFFDDPINGIHWELAWVPNLPTPRQVWSFYRSLRGFARSRPDLADTVPGVMFQARRTLPRG